VLRKTNQKQFSTHKNFRNKNITCANGGKLDILPKNPLNILC